METLLHDIRFGARTLLKNPGFTIVAIIALALGIGANTAIFSVIDAVLLKPLPFGHPDRLVFIWERPPEGGDTPMPASALNYQDWRARSKAFKTISARTQRNFNLTAGSDPERLAGEMVTPGYFGVIEVSPLLGRFFATNEGEPGNEHVVVLSKKLWQRRFGSDSSIVGRPITLNNEPYTVVGIAPDDHRPTIELWTPLVLAAAVETQDRGWKSLQVIARLGDGVSLAQANAEMGRITAGIAEEHPETNKGWTASVMPMHEMMVKNIRTPLLILLGAVGFVLLIACANVANLLLARISSRRREIAIRTAMGAGRGRIVRQLLTESILLSLAGGSVGVLVALWGTDLIARLNVLALPRASEIGVDTEVLLYALGISVVTGLVFGLLPALQGSKTNLTEPLKDGSRAISGGIRGGRIRGILVLSEVALALLLLIGAGLLIRSFATLQEIHTGFDPTNVLTLQLSLSESKYPDPARQIAAIDQLMQRIGGLPGVVSAGATSTLPLAQGSPKILFAVHGRPIPMPTDAPNTNLHSVTNGYFQTMRIPLITGRQFNERDNATGENVAVVNETMAKQIWPGESPIGRKLCLGIPLGMPADSIPWITVVGVVGDVKHSALNNESGMEFYTPMGQNPDAHLALTIRTKGAPLELTPSVRREISAIDRDLPLYQIQTMEEVVANSLAQPRFYMLLLGIFAGVALLLSAIGIYGVIAQTVTQRTHEIGIRMALGAQRRDVLAMVLKQGMKLTAVGITIGLAGAFALTRLMASLLYGVSATDPLTFLGVALLLGCVAFVACYIPARRATRVEPIQALRYE